MPDILRLQAKDFELTIWCSDINRRLASYQRTLEHRGTLDSPREVTFKIAPSIELESVECLEKELEPVQFETGNITLPSAVFFENNQYHVEWVFFDDVDDSGLEHTLQRLNESFRFTPGSNRHGRELPARLSGSINTGNDVGWLTLPFFYTVNGQRHRHSLSFEVLATKMDLHSDLPVMYQTIDEQIPLWRFSLTEQTEQDASKGDNRGNFPLLWLASFKALRLQFEDGLRVITQAPHNRLKPTVSHVRADRIKGKLSRKLETRVRESLANGLENKRYRVEKKHLSVDTQENRFIKMVVNHCYQRLQDIEQQLQKDNQQGMTPRLSQTFFDQLNEWKAPLKKMHSQSFLREVGKYSGQFKESLVLQQKTGYCAVYHVWQELKFYLDLFANQSQVSVKSVAEVYEVWCFLTLRKILIDQLGFEDVSSKQTFTQQSQFLEHKLQDGLSGAFHFTRSDGVTARLIHEPFISRYGSQLRSYLVNQKPDIVLEVTFAKPSNKSFLWLFDAKYRIKPTNGRDLPNRANQNEQDLVPDDAINQMHRYRDSLIRISQDKSQIETKSRPVVGAFALYPGFFDQRNSDNPYRVPIDEVDIGAFALLPQGDQQNGQHWLTDFLRQQLGTGRQGSSYSSGKLNAERLHIRESARIPYSGMKQRLYSDLCLTVALAGKKQRDGDYFKRYETGQSKWYHIPVSSFDEQVAAHVLNEIRYLAVAGNDCADTYAKKIEKVWPVEGVVIKPRKEIGLEQSGKVSSSEQLYYLFKLGTPMSLLNPINGIPQRPFNRSIKLTTLQALQSCNSFAELTEVYCD